MPARRVISGFAHHAAGVAVVLLAALASPLHAQSRPVNYRCWEWEARLTEPLAASPRCGIPQQAVGALVSGWAKESLDGYSSPGPSGVVRIGSFTAEAGPDDRGATIDLAPYVPGYFLLSYSGNYRSDAFPPPLPCPFITLVSLFSSQPLFAGGISTQFPPISAFDLFNGVVVIFTSFPDVVQGLQGTVTRLAPVAPERCAALAPKPRVTITGVKSAQLEQARCNNLPAPDGASRNDPMLLGARADGRVYLEVAASVEPVTLASKVVIAVRERASRRIVEARTESGPDPWLVSFAPDEHQAMLYEVVAGVDEDGNGLSDGEILDVFGTGARYGILAVSASHYRGQVKILGGMRRGTWGLTYRLVSAFLQPTPNPSIQSATRTAAPLAASHPDLSHPVGQAWSQECVADANVYSFEPGSDISENLLRTCQMARIVRSVLRSRSREVQDAFAAQPGLSEYKAPRKDFGPECIGNRRKCPGNPWVDGQQDLTNLPCLAYSWMFALGNADFSGSLGFTVRREGLRVSALEFEAVSRDLYDFDISGDFGQLAAPIQAGFPTLGLSGRTFFVQIRVKAESSRFNFYPEWGHGPEFSFLDPP